MLHERTWHSVTERSNVSNAAAAASDDSAANRLQLQQMPLICRWQSNGFILDLIIVPNDHMRPPWQICSTTEHCCVSDDDGRAWGHVCGGKSLPRQSWVDSPVVNCHAAVRYHVVQCHIAADELVAIRHCSYTLSSSSVITVFKNFLRFNLVICLLHYAKKDCFDAKHPQRVL